jgi:succinate dehydrogenase / fumarate reductase flavoprotein subunit
MNAELEKAGRVADYLELGELVCIDALTRNESCGAPFREEYQTPDGEALRNDADYGFVSCWAYRGDDQAPQHYQEPLDFAEVDLITRSYQ